MGRVEDNKIKKNRNYLESYQELLLDFDREIEKAKYWKAVSYDIGASKLDESGVTKTGYSNFNPVDKFLEISERCEGRADVIDSKMQEIEEAVNKVEKKYERRVLKLHYINDYGFHYISKALALNLDYVYRLHIQGLKSFEIPNL